MERKKKRVDESSALTALVMLVVEIIREDEILVITAPLSSTPATKPFILGAQSWPNGFICLAQSPRLNISLRSHTHFGKLGKYKDNSKIHFQARPSLLKHSEQKVSTHEEPKLMDVQSFAVAEAGEGFPEDQHGGRYYRSLLVPYLVVKYLLPAHCSVVTLCYSMDCSFKGSSVHGISQARILEWVAMSSSRGKSLEWFLYLVGVILYGKIISGKS